jgi:hypothetical protein
LFRFLLSFGCSTIDGNGQVRSDRLITHLQGRQMPAVLRHSISGVTSGLLPALRGNWARDTWLVARQVLVGGWWLWLAFCGL